MAGAILVAAVPPLALGHPFTDWFYRSLVLLVIACPCALVISTPVSIVSGLTAAARKGILIKGGVYLEEAGSLKAMAFDKTGTLTQGVPKVTDIISLDSYTQEEILRIAAALEHRSQHHLGKAIIEEANRRGIDYPEAGDFQSLTGKGVKAKVEGKVFFIGNHRFCEKLGKCNAEIDTRMPELERERKTAVILTNQNEALGIIAIADQVRQESPSAVQQLKTRGIEKMVMLTGDNRGTAEAIAGSLQIAEYHAELMPEDKAAIVKSLTEKYGKVAMVGDGVNDAPAMAAASMGIAMGAIGTDTALETADIALMTDDLSKLPFLLKLSKRTLGVIKQNIAFSLLVKGVFIALAVPGMATLWMAVGADMGASILVIFNGLRLLATREN
jgi:Cd2+/Zn2+-exporting ATPase